MMRRIDLLPASIAQQRRQRRQQTLVIFAGMAVVGLMLLWWLALGGQISRAESDLADVQASNAQLDQQIAALQEFALLELELVAKQTALQVVMVGDINWPALMTELAMVVPGEVWLESLNASAGGSGTAAPTESAPVRVSPKTAIGRITFQGRSLTMPGVAKWLIRLGTTKQFFAAYLTNASRGQGGDELNRTVAFSSSVELSDRTASGRFQFEALP